MPPAHPDTLEPDPVTPKRSWPIGTLTVLAVAAVVAGGLFLGTRPSDDDPGATPPIGEGTSAFGTLPRIGEVEVPRDGDSAADFTVELLDGSTFNLANHLREDGRPVFLNLWASWCMPCREEMPAIDAAARDHPDVLFLGVAVEDDPSAAEEFAADIGVSYPLAVEESDSLARDYPYFGLPATFLIAGDGVLVGTIFGGVDNDQIADLVLDFF